MGDRGQVKEQAILNGKDCSGYRLDSSCSAPVQLGNKGGIITLLDDRELKVDGVLYTEQEAQREG
jgi:hypothetical protein